jgi:hypothetical protein
MRPRSALKEFLSREMKNQFQFRKINVLEISKKEHGQWLPEAEKCLKQNEDK